MKQEISREAIYRRQLNLMSLLVAILMIILIITFKFVIDVSASKNEVQALPQVVDEVVNEVVNEVIEVKEDVYFTSYYVGDGSSSNKTGSGITIDHFKINENGWYTYNDKVVVATATYQGLASNYGVLKKYKEEVEGIQYYNYTDELTIEVNGKQYKAIVLDTCGASHDKEYLDKYDEGLNRIDIFVADKKYQVHKVKGSIVKGVS